MQRLFRNLKTLAAGLCAAGAVTLASAQGAAPATYNVGATATGIPFTFLDVKTNTIQGMMVDAIQTVGKAGGFQANVQQTVFSSLIPSLTSKKIDIIRRRCSRQPPGNRWWTSPTGVLLWRRRDGRGQRRQGLHLAG